jgi:single-strand DNA-binding protein
MINKTILIGRVGRDPETRYTQGGKAVCNFSVATSESWKDSNGEKKESTEWHRIVAFGKLAEICGKYVVKGMLVYVDGRLQTQKYDKDGVTHYKTEIIAQNMQMLSGKGDGEKQDRQPAHDPQYTGPSHAGGGFDGDAPDDDPDGIPF